MTPTSSGPRSAAPQWQGTTPAAKAGSARKEAGTVSASGASTSAPAAPDVIVVDGLSKRFVIRKDNSLKERVVTLGRAGRQHKDDFWALRDVTLSIAAGNTIGLLGPNGSGKSTLLKTIGGIIQPTTGTVHKRGRLAALLELGAGFHPDLTGRENVYLNASILGFSQRETTRNFDSIVDFAGIGEFIDTQVKFYSSGMYVRLAFAVAIHMDPDILLVDEVLAVGDELFQKKCLDKIRSFQTEGRTIVLVTHSTGQVADLCNRAVVLNHGSLVFDGAPLEAIDHLRDALSANAAEGKRPEAASPTAVDSVVIGSRSQPIQRIAAGDDLTVCVTVSHPGSLEGWRVDLRVDAPNGQRAVATNTDLLETSLPAGPGLELPLTFTLPRARLGAGQYVISADLVDDNGVRAATRTAENNLHVTGDLRVRGLVDVPDVTVRLA